MKLDHFRPIRPVQLCLPDAAPFQELLASGPCIVDEGDVKRLFGNRVRLHPLPPREGRMLAVKFYPQLTVDDVPNVKRLIAEYVQRSRQRGPLYAPLKVAHSLV